jgi:hypothetical protein
MQNAQGIVTVVQEGRFSLATPDGRSLRFALSSKAKPGALDLAALRDRMTPVRVGYKTDASRSDLVAHEVRELEAS